MGASGRIVEVPLQAVDLLNAEALPEARLGYALMVQMLQGQEPLAFEALALGGSAVVQGLSRYGASMRLTGSGG